MFYRVQTILVGPRVERGEVVVVNIFSLLGHVVEFDSVGATTEKGISGLEPGHEFEGIDQGTDRLVFSLQEFPFALPHDDDAVTQGEQGMFFASGGFVTTVAGVSNVDVGFGVEVRQPFQGREGMGFALRVPTADRFGGQLSFGHVLGAVEQIASRGDGNTPF